MSAVRRLRESQFTALDSPDPLVDMKASLVHMNSPNTAVVRTGISTCVASTIVDADIDTVAAWEMEKLSRDNMKVHRQEDGRERSLVEDDPKGTAIYRICLGVTVLHGLMVDHETVLHDLMVDHDLRRPLLEHRLKDAAHVRLALAE